MRRRLAAALALTALVTATASPGATTATRPASCAAPVLLYLDAPYAPVKLRSARVKLGLRVTRPAVARAAALVDSSNCIDVVACAVNEPCAPPDQPPPLIRPVRVTRLAGIAPRVAVADRDDTRVIYVAVARIACLERGHGRALVRCLRSASR